MPIDAETETLPGLAEATRFQRDLYLYWRTACALGSLPLTSRRYVTRPTVRRLRAALALDPGSVPAAPDDDRAEGEDPRLFFLRRLLERLGLLRLSADGTRLEPGPAEEMERYLALSLAARLRTDVRLWVAGGWWPDKPDPRAEPPRIRVPAPPRLALARRRLVEALSALEPGTTIALSSAEAGPKNRLHARSILPRLRILPHATSAPNALSLASLPPDDLATARSALDGPLRWLGLITASTTGETPESPHAGAAVLAVRAGEGAEPGPEEASLLLREVGGRVVIQPDASIIALPPLTAPTLVTLDRYADEVSLDTTARYRLSEAALARALSRGWDVARVTADLEALSGAPLPGNIATLLGDWARRSERVRLLPDTVILEVPRPALLDALQREAGAREWIERRLTPTAALLRPESVGAVRAWLLRHGEFPALTGTDSSAQSEDPTS